MTRSMPRFSRALPILIAVGAQFTLLDAQALPIPAMPANGSSVWTDDRPFELSLEQIGGVVGQSGLASFYDARFASSAVTTGGGANAQVTFTADVRGTEGGNIAVVVENSGAANSPLMVSVIGTLIRVTVATDASGAATSTAAHVAAAVNAMPAASALVNASAGGTGTGVVQNLSSTLAPVIAEAGAFAASYSTVFGNSASFPQDAAVTYGSGAAISASSLFLYVRGGGQSPGSYFFDLLAPEFDWNGTDALLLSGFWPGAGSIEQIQIVGTASRPTSVPEGSTLTLLLLGIGIAGALGRNRRRAGAASLS